jgi:type I restriction enzyme R subunit
LVATGTDIKPLEVVMFMRDVRSEQYFEQMRGRGARTILASDLQRATPSAERKDRFIIVDAIGVTESCKTPTEPLERDRTVSLEALLERVAFGHTDEDTWATLAGRLARLQRRLALGADAELVGLRRLRAGDADRATADDRAGGRCRDGCGGVPAHPDSRADRGTCIDRVAERTRRRSRRAAARQPPTAGDDGTAARSRARPW